MFNNENRVIPSRFSGEGPCVSPWSSMNLRNTRSLGQGPRDDDFQFPHTAFALARGYINREIALNLVGPPPHSHKQTEEC